MCVLRDPQAHHSPLTHYLLLSLLRLLRLPASALGTIVRSLWSQVQTYSWWIEVIFTHALITNFFKKLHKTRTICLETRSSNRAVVSQSASYCCVSWLCTHWKDVYADLIIYHFSVDSFPCPELSRTHGLPLEPNWIFLTKATLVRKPGRLHPRIQFTHQFCLT